MEKIYSVYIIPQMFKGSISENNDCVLILHDEWIDKGILFVRGKNCLGCRDENDIASILKEDRDYSKIVKESKKILKKHIDVVW